MREQAVTGRVSAVEASRLLRAERTAALAERLRAGDFDAARLESTPRRRAEVLAAVLSRALSRGAMRRRLRRLGVSREFEGGTLLAVSVEGGGLDVRRRDRRGQVLTGPGLDERLLDVFPELVPFTLTNLTLNCSGTGAIQAGFRNSVSQTLAGAAGSLSATGTEAYNLSLYLTEYLASAARVDSYTGQLSGTAFNFATISNTVCTGVYASANIPPWLVNSGGAVKWLSGTFGIPVTWPAAGINWVETHAEQANAVVGAMSWSATVAGSSFPNTVYGWGQDKLTITYTIPPCDTCSLALQVNSACEGADPVQGGVFSLGIAGLECTQDGSGVCTISGIPDGEYTWEWTKTGYQTLTGTFTCECAGGDFTLFLSVTPDGGCPGDGCNLTVSVVDACDGSPVVGAEIVLGDVSCETGDTGTCTLTGLPDGSNSGTITADGYEPQIIAWDCVEGGAGSITVELVPVGGCPGDAAVCTPPLAFGAPSLGGLAFLAEIDRGLAFGPPADRGLLMIEHG